MKILVVEDDAILGELLREYLQQLGHERVRVCLSAFEAFSAMKEDVYDCAFVDLRLPDMDGLRVLESVKAQDPILPIVMMSGYPTMGSTIEAMRKGASDFLTKPFNIHDMALALERVTKERKLLLENLSLELECRARKQLEIVNRELEGKVQEQAKLFEISAEIDRVRSSGELYPQIVQLASRLTAAQKVGFFILPPEQDNLLIISEKGLNGDLSGRHIIPGLGMRLKEKLGSEKGNVIVEAGELLDLSISECAVPKNAAFACWPLFIRGRLFGLLATSCNDGSRDFPPVEEKLIDFLMKKAALAVENMALYESMTHNFHNILKSLVNALEAKDLYTGKHSERVTMFALDIAKKLGCSTDQIEALKTVGYLHDIGKIGIADSILNKPATLTSHEYEIVKNHPVIGVSIVKDLGLDSDETAIIRHHHERWDGSGYPEGLSRLEIPLVARIVMVADAFDAMTSKRAYRDAMAEADAIRELQRNAGKQFDSDVVEAFMETRKD